jgi:hypothetical protein
MLCCFLSKIRVYPETRRVLGSRQEISHCAIKKRSNFLLGRNRRCARSWCRRARWCIGRRSASCTTRRNLRCRRRNLRCRRHVHGALQHAARATRASWARIAEISQCQSANKEQHGKYRRRARQEVCTSACTEQTASTATAKCCAHVSTLAMLHQDQSDHAQRRQNLYSQHQVQQNIHL